MKKNVKNLISELNNVREEFSDGKNRLNSSIVFLIFF